MRWGGGSLRSLLRMACAQGAAAASDEAYSFVGPDGIECVDMAPKTFHAIRELFGVSRDRYVAEWDFEDECGLEQGSGRQGLFLKSKCGTLLMKTILSSEFETLEAIIADYHKHLLQHPSSLLTPFFACHKLTQGLSTCYVLVQKNLCDLTALPKELFSRELEVFDLKGRLPKRAVPLPQEGKVVKDTHCHRLFPLPEGLCAALHTQLRADVAFLRAHELMDYSLLIAVAHPAEATSAPRRQSPPVSSSATAALPQLPSNPTRAARSVFRRHYGGVAAAAPAAGEVYFIGVIDSLTHYGVAKGVANFCKRLVWHAPTLSTVPPEFYAGRLLFYASSLFGTPPQPMQGGGLKARASSGLPSARGRSDSDSDDLRKGAALARP
eukprot:RCo040850